MNIKKVKLYEDEIEDIKEKIRAMASHEIYRAKCFTYKGYASNSSEGDYGSWDDWFILITRYGDKIIDMLVEAKE